MQNNSGDFSWITISDRRIDEFESVLGKRAVDVGGVYWREVRFGFYRPLLQFREFPVAGTVPPLWARLGAAQFAVADSSVANSTLNCLFFENAREYSIEQLDQNRSRQVKVAAKHFTIRPVTNLDEFKRRGHVAYLSFYDRTKYPYGASRRDPVVFSRWAEILFEMPEILILGAYDQGELVGVSLSYLSGDTVCYTAFFCSTESLKHFVSDLMLHTLRSAAVHHPAVRRVFAGMYKGLEGLDRFYLLRGAQRVRKPALLKINPFLRYFLRQLSPLTFSKMMGQFA